MATNVPIVGRVGESYSDADADIIGKGRVIVLDSPNGPKVFKLVKNANATSLAASVSTQVSDPTANSVTINNTASAPLFAGALPVGAASVVQNNWGYVQIAGKASLLEATGAGFVAGDLLAQSAGDATKGVLDKAANTAAGAQGTFAIADAGQVGVLNSALPCTIVRNAWGQYTATP